MILDAIVLVLIVLLTLYLSTQGVLTAAIALITATFASILSMALFEPLEFIVGNYRPDYARGVTLLLLFFLAFSGIRIAADAAVPKNILLPKWINRLSGGVVGFFAALVVVGTTLIGVTMMPLPTSIIGYDRFPAKAEGDSSATHDRMQVLRDENGTLVDVPGEVAPQKGIWFSPDRFVLAIWNLASGRSLGGSVAFADVHPDLSVETYGYRNVVQYGAGRTLLPSLVRVEGAYRDKTPADLQRFKLAGFNDPASDKPYQAMVIRTEVDQGTDQPKLSADTDNYFRITPTQIRLVTDKGHQYYPVGYLEEGTKFRQTSLASGQIIDDYSASLKIVQDWVFPIGEDEKPVMLEVKQLARMDVANTPALANADKALPFKPLATGYPPQKQNPAVFTLTLETINADKSHSPIAKADVFIVTSTIQKSEIEGLIQRAHDQLLDAQHAWDSNERGWGDQLNGKPGVPEKYLIQSNVTTAREITLKAPDDRITLSWLIPVLLNGELTPDGPRNLAAADKYFNEKIVPLLKNSPTSSLVDHGTTDGSGKYKITLSKGSYAYIVRVKTGEFMGVWCKDFNAQPKAVINEKLDTGSVDFKVDLRAKK